MTFTALIASVSHILIHPAIVLEKWDVMLICIAVATAASLVSARFANRANNRTVGLVTGAVLTVLGAAMLLVSFLFCLGMLVSLQRPPLPRAVVSTLAAALLGTAAALFSPSEYDTVTVPVVIAAAPPTPMPSTGDARF